MPRRQEQELPAFPPMPYGNGNALSEEHKQAFITLIRSGQFEEWQLVKFIQSYLITRNQQHMITVVMQTGLSDVLGGRISGGAQQAKIAEYFADWNAKLGTDIFGKV